MRTWERGVHEGALRQQGGVVAVIAMLAGLAALGLIIRNPTRRNHRWYD